MHEMTTIILNLKGINLQNKHKHELYFRILKHFSSTIVTHKSPPPFPCETRPFKGH